MQAILALVTAILPSVVKLIQTLVAHQTPGVPPPTSGEVLDAFAKACASSLAVDDEWLEAHPPDQG
jgi:hypothetical protein